jgi:vacuolar-type H+-ATPase subunit E/Vma4
MATKKPQPPGGSRKGIPNRSTANAREAIARFVDGNVERLQEWLDEIAERDPLLAFKCFSDLVEYHVPKLSRAEVTADVTVRSAEQELAELNKKAHG